MIPRPPEYPKHQPPPPPQPHQTADATAEKIRQKKLFHTILAVMPMARSKETQSTQGRELGPFTHSGPDLAVHLRTQALLLVVKYRASWEKRKKKGKSGVFGKIGDHVKHWFRRAGLEVDDRPSSLKGLSLPAFIPRTPHHPNRN